MLVERARQTHSKGRISFSTITIITGRRIGVSDLSSRSQQPAEEWISGYIQSTVFIVDLHSNTLQSPSKLIEDVRSQTEVDNN